MEQMTSRDSRCYCGSPRASCKAYLHDYHNSIEEATTGEFDMLESGPTWI
jgi:hypothetical protein